METPLFSIIIPTLNEEGYIGYLLKDLTNQTRKNFEIHVIDGHSVDNTVKIASEYTNRLNLRIEKAKKRNLSHQRNYGASLSKGKYLVFLDADIRISTGFISNLTREVKKNTFLIYLPTLLPQSRSYGDIITFQLMNRIIEFSQILGKPFPSGGAMIFHHDYFNHINGFTENNNGTKLFPEDIDILLRAQDGGVRAKFMKNVQAKFSLRRIVREGRMRAYQKYLVGITNMYFKGKMEEEVEYEMGGHMYKKSKKRQSTLFEKQKEFMDQVKIIFNKLLEEE